MSANVPAGHGADSTSQAQRIAQAYVRKPGDNLAQGISPARGTPDPERALYQHDMFCAALARLGVEVKMLRTDPLFPDGCFISDTAVVTDRLAVISNFDDRNPRQGEQQAVAALLSASRFLKYIAAPARLHAADALELAGHFYIGLSAHTNRAGAEQLAGFLKEFGHEATILALPQEDAPRLREAVAWLGGNHILIREELARHYAFLAYEKIVVPQEEKGAANATLVNDTVLMPAGYPKTAAAVRRTGRAVVELGMSEFEKMNGGLGCLALRLSPREQGNVVLLQKRAAAQ